MHANLLDPHPVWTRPIGPFTLTTNQMEFLANWVDELPFVSLSLRFFNQGILIGERCKWIFSFRVTLEVNIANGIHPYFTNNSKRTKTWFRVGYDLLNSRVAYKSPEPAPRGTWVQSLNSRQLPLNLKAPNNITTGSEETFAGPFRLIFETVLFLPCVDRKVFWVLHGGFESMSEIHESDL